MWSSKRNKIDWLIYWTGPFETWLLENGNPQVEVTRSFPLKVDVRGSDQGFRWDLSVVLWRLNDFISPLRWLSIYIYLGKYWFCLCLCFVSFWQQDLKAACKGEDSPVVAQVSVALRDTERARTPRKVEYRLWSAWFHIRRLKDKSSMSLSPIATKNKYKWLNLPFSLYQGLNSKLPNPSLLIQIQNLLIFC